MAVEKRVIGNNILMERLGWSSATALGFGTLGGSIWLIHSGQSVAGLGGVIFALSSLLGLYVRGRHDQIQEITKKRAADMVTTESPSEQLNLLPPATDR